MRLGSSQTPSMKAFATPYQYMVVGCIRLGDHSVLRTGGVEFVRAWVADLGNVELDERGHPSLLRPHSTAQQPCAG